nr:hypothetical protein CFP56_37858 [Quercus suber]
MWILQDHYLWECRWLGLVSHFPCWVPVLQSRSEGYLDLCSMSGPPDTLMNSCFIPPCSLLSSTVSVFDIWNNPIPHSEG